MPFALKSCECLNFTTSQQAQLQAQVTNVSAQINLLQARLNSNASGSPYINAHCPSGNCPVVNSLRSQILQLKAYASLMNSTVHSNCCNRTLYVLRDNLASYPFWIYGNTTHQNYTASLLNRTNGSKVAVCPANLPFVNVSTNQCFVCPPSDPLYDLGQSKCIPACSSNSSLMLNITSHTCVINRTCNPGYFFNNKTQNCTFSLGTSSRCPPSTPVWNGSTLQCQYCKASEPYFDIAIRACRACTANEFYDPFNRICYNRAFYHPFACPNGTAFNLLTSKCQSLNAPANSASNVSVPVVNAPPPTTGIASSCPPYAPYWDQAALVCSRCPSSTPYFDPATGSCKNCPPGTHWSTVVTTCVTTASLTNCAANQYWDSALKHCIPYPHCSVNQIFNNLTKQCQSVPQVGNVGSCPPSTPYWNTVSLTCQRCPIATPLYNSTNGSCSACPSNTKYDVTTNTCVSTIINCPSGTIFNSTVNTCQPVACPQSTPIYNRFKKACEACPAGTIYNFVVKVCESPAQYGLVSVCPPSTPYWNPVNLGCEACPFGQVLNPSTQTCVVGASHLAAMHLRRDRI